MYFFYKFIDLPLQFCYNGENTGKEAPRVTDRQIRCFLALYETLNFSAAARQLFLTQPTLSYQIRTLEEELPLPKTSGRAIRRFSMHWPPGPPGAKSWCCRCR